MNLISLCANTYVCDKDGNLQDMIIHYEVPKKWLVDNYLSKLLDIQSDMITDKNIEDWINMAEEDDKIDELISFEIYYHALEDNVIANEVSYKF